MKKHVDTTITMAATPAGQGESQSEILCPICGGNTFSTFGKRMSFQNKRPPQCQTCRSLERHRISYLVYKALPSSFFKDKVCLHFAPDISVPDHLFKNKIDSRFGIVNTLDIANMQSVKDNSYDWVVANHVIEHVDNDTQALAEILRILTREGVFHMMVPRTNVSLVDIENPRHPQHCREYGTELIFTLLAQVEGLKAIQVVACDSVTSDWDVVYFISKISRPLEEMAAVLLKKGFIVLAASQISDHDVAQNPHQ